MTRRRNKKGFIELMWAQPWWVNCIFAFASFIILRWILPRLFLSANPVLTYIAKQSYSVALMPLFLFGFFAVVGLVRAKFRPVNKPVALLDAQNKRHSDAEVLPVIDRWSLENLRLMDWKRFELLTAKYYELLGFKSVTIRCGADGGIDVKLFKVDLTQPVAIVQCKAWNTTLVGVKELRELLGVMTYEKVRRGIFVTTGAFTKDALNFGATSPIQMLDGAGFLSKITSLPDQQQLDLLQFAFEGDYATPTCASCGIKMIKRESKRGAFWGCLNFPRCKSKFPIKI